MVKEKKTVKEKSGEARIESNASEQPVNRVIARILIGAYLAGVILSGYCYLSRPVRADQIRDGYAWWRSIGTIYNIPAPKDERWE